MDHGLIFWGFHKNDTATSKSAFVLSKPVLDIFPIVETIWKNSKKRDLQKTGFFGIGRNFDDLNEICLVFGFIC